MYSAEGNYVDQLNAKVGEDAILWIPSDPTIDVNRRRISEILKANITPADFTKKLESISDIKVLEYRYDPTTYTCANYVFGVKIGEPWALPYKSSLYSDEHPLWTNTSSFLDAKGYSPASKVSPGDVVLYESYLGLQHFGFVTEDGINSKLGQCAIVCHSFELVPITYGNKLTFFSKRN